MLPSQRGARHVVNFAEPPFPMEGRTDVGRRCRNAEGGLQGDHSRSHSDEYQAVEKIHTVLEFFSLASFECFTLLFTNETCPPPLTAVQCTLQSNDFGEEMWIFLHKIFDISVI